MAIENGTNSYMPPKTLMLFENEISPLMAFLGNQDDYVLYNNTTPKYFIDFWAKLNLKLPKFINNTQLASLNISNIVPWGWSQLIEKQFQSLFNDKSKFTHLKSHDDHKQFFSRISSVKLIEELSQKTLPDFVSLPTLPKIVDDTKAILEHLRANNDGIVIKNLWSSSGRGITFIKDEKGYNQKLNWIRSQLKKHKSLIIEPIYNKVQDASLQFIIDNDRNYTFLGINYFDSDEEGHFEKEYFHTPTKLQNALPDNKQWIQQLAAQLIRAMQTQNIHNQYNGPIGIDVMFIADENEQVKLYPLIEANLRCNMGLINLHIKKLLANNVKGHWCISTFKPGEALTFYVQQIQKHPIQVQDNKISEGFFPLTPFTNNTRFAAWGLIEK